MSETKKKFDKFAIAAALQEIGSLLELKGGMDRFKARAYKAGARAVAGLNEDIAKVIQQGRLRSIRGIGSALASQIEQLYQTGESSVLRNLRQEFPPGILELSRVQGLTLPKISQLHQALGISSIADLQAAAEAGKVSTVKGFGAKTEQKLLEAIRQYQDRGQTEKRLHIHHAERTGEQILNYLQTSRDLDKASFAGALRRWQETVGAIRVVASSKNPAAVVKHFLQFPLIVNVIDEDNDRCTVELADGGKVMLTVVRPNKFPLTLIFETGSNAHLEKLQKVGNKGSKAKTQIRSEEDFYNRLGMQFIPPELREDNGEIEAAIAGKLPQDLVSLDDVRGMVHCHTTYSDGVNSLLQMAQAADALKMQYMTITDHSPTAFYANGLKLDRLQQQWDEIDEVQEQVKVKLLRGTESDILADGALDYPDHVLEKLDVILASIHSRYKMDSEAMTKRIVAAMRHPLFKIWGHALGRLIQRRPPFECDLERILDVIAESRAAIEINGDPYRLDLEPRWVREARKRKIKFVISVDAHSTGALNYLRYGVGMARRGWVRRGEVLNTLTLKGFQKAVRPSL
ncbi:MAG TPA: DNA polymerase/3'-5' exonuclease PolX [Pyrinomonadaceae bacterium]|nr:DNA polymerase/3'-5' exonuclease PolX [Pyrinomonadaceae bacterium]